MQSWSSAFRARRTEISNRPVGSPYEGLSAGRFVWANVAIRWWWVVLGATGLLVGRATVGPDTHWVNRNGNDWRALSPAAQTAYAEGFLAGSALGQAVTVGSDSAALTQEIARLRREGRFRLPF